MLILTVTWIRWNPVMNIMEQYNNQVKGELDKEIKNKYKIFCNSIKEMRKETKDQVKLIKDQVNTIKQSMSQYEMGKITESDIVDIITSEIRKFKEDHVQVTDYAMQSAGASIIKSRTSEAYQTDHLNWMLFNSIHWRYSLIPEIMLQPDIYPGNCWAFTGKAGHALIRLADTIIPRAVTIQHVPRAISQIKDFSSAPRDFEVFGFNNEVDATGENLGQFTYDPIIQLIQSFRLRNKHAKKFRYVQLKIVNNWGNAEFTCIYRFRVHQEIPRQLYS
ncbi:SUN domain-containing protein 2-like [Mixophyes fleayi]|uniref:SUN domain-containing protein 2-like n=1 Tax=Mixophyes fleayi TaxID=3061075 RepID=UPI003F4D9F22